MSDEKSVEAGGDDASAAKDLGSDPPVPQRRPVLRDPVTGRLLPGSASLNPRGSAKGTRRPRLVDVARELADASGGTLEEALQRVLGAMLKRAVDGDTQAARLLLERLTASDQEEVAAAFRQRVEVDAVGPPVPEGRSLIAYMRGLRDDLLASARVLADKGDAGRAEFAGLGAETFTLATDAYERALAVGEAERDEVDRLLS